MPQFLSRSLIHMREAPGFAPLWRPSLRRRKWAGTFRLRINATDIDAFLHQACDLNREEAMVSRARLSEAQNWRCAYCQGEMSNEDSGASHYATRDHVAPLHVGGGRGWDNLVAACRACNLLKGDHAEASAFAWCRGRMAVTARWPAGTWPDADALRVFRRRVEERTYEQLLEQWRSRRGVKKPDGPDRRRMRDEGGAMGVVYSC